MAELNELSNVDKKNWKTKIMIIGTIIGALTGAGAAYLLIQKAESEGDLDLTAGEGVKLGVTVFGFLRQISQLGK